MRAHPLLGAAEYYKKDITVLNNLGYEYYSDFAAAVTDCLIRDRTCHNDG